MYTSTHRDMAGCATGRTLADWCMTIGDWIVLAGLLVAVARLLVAVIDCFCGFFDRGDK